MVVRGYGPDKAVLQMLEGLSHEWALYRLRRRKQKIRRTYEKLRRRIQAKNKLRDMFNKETRKELEELAAEERFEIDFVDDAIARAQSSHLIQQAEKFLLPIPEFQQEGGAWEQSDQTMRWRLTREAMIALRKALRQERKERFESVQKWLTSTGTFVSILTGLVGVLVALVAVL